jgi:hypothetical protein
MVKFAENKLALIQEISLLEDEKTFLELQKAFQVIIARHERKSIVREPIRAHFDADNIKKNRQFKGHNLAEINQLIADINLQEPVELLISQLSK